MKLILATLLAAASVSAAQAQAVYRCGNAYSQAPCPQARLVDASDERSAAQQAEARRVAEGEHRLEAEMRRERLADERSLRPAGAASLSGHTPQKMAVVAPEHRQKKKSPFAKPQPTSDFIAYDPSSRKRRSN